MTDPPATDIRRRDRDAIVQALRAGVVPALGLQHIQVGRRCEVEAMIADIDRIADNGSSLRFLIGGFGSGKSFLLALVRSIALKRKLVTLHADLSPDRRLHGSAGQARSLCAELMGNLATQASPNGGALAGVVERFVSATRDEATRRKVEPDAVMAERLESLSELVGGYDFAQVIRAYWRGHDQEQESLKSDAVRWLRAEFTSKRDARKALNVATIVDDANWYDHLKLLARFVRLAGFSGLLVCLDELVNLYKLANTQARNMNYEQILRILNDTLQGGGGGLGFVLGGTPEFLSDPRRGLYSYPALQSRLAENPFAGSERVDYSGPVLRLANLSRNEFYVLLTNLRRVYAFGDPTAYLVPDEALVAFMRHCETRVGDAYFRTPRTTITEFINLLAVVDQNPDLRWADLISRVELAAEANPDLAPLPDDTQLSVTATPPSVSEPPTLTADDLPSFRL